MATLNNTRISDTYFGLIKTIDNAVISATLRELTDGSGNQTGLYINNAGDFKVNSVLEFGSLKDTGENITISKFVDAADGIGNNNNDTSIPTSAAVVSYVAAQITAEDLDFTGDDAAVAGDVDLNSEQFRILGTTNEIETSVVSAGGNQLRVGIVTNPTLSGNVSITGNVDYADNAKARFGASQDLEIYHDGSNSFIKDTGTGQLKVSGSQVLFYNAAVNAFMVRMVEGAEVELYYNSSKKLETTNTGLTVTGKISGLTDPTANQDAATKAYVDSLDAGSDLDFSGDSGTGDVNLNAQTFAVTGTTNQITTSASNQTLNLSLPSTVHRNLQGNVTGNLTGNVTGNVTGDLTGNVTATSVLASGVTATTQSTGDNSTKVATTAYVDSLDAASDLDFSADSGTTGAVVLNTQTLAIVGTANEVETSASNQQLQIGLPSSINVNSASATILQTARDISLTGQATATISSFNGSANVSGAVTLDNDSVTGKVLTGLASPTASNILASDSILQAFGKAQSQINTLAGGLRFMGTWNANTNSPTLASGGGEADSGTTTGTATNKLIQSGQNFTSSVTNGDQVVNQASGATALVTNVDSNTQLTLDADIMVSGQAYTIDNSPFLTQGHYYVVSVGGTQSLNGLSNWAVGDWVIAGADNVWEKLDHTQVDGTGTAGNIAKFSSTNVIADSIMAESGAVVTVTGGLTTTANLISQGTAYFWGNTTIGDSYGDNHTMNGQLIQTSTEGVGIKLSRRNGTTGLLVSSSGDSNIQFGTDNGSGSNTDHWTIGKDNTDNSFRISAGSVLGTTDKLKITTSSTTSYQDLVMGSSDIKFADNGHVYLGDSNDLDLYHDGSNSYIKNGIGSLLIQNTNDDYHVIIQSDNGGGGLADYFRAKGDTGEAILYHYGNQKLATTTSGIAVTGGGTFSSGTTTDILRFGADLRWGFSRANSDNRYLSFMRNQNGSGTAVWTVDGDNGNCGIGNTLPSAKLEISDATNDNLRIGTRGGNINIFSVNDAGATAPLRLEASDFQFINGNATFAGSVGIGGAPDNILTLTGTAGDTHQRFKEASTTIGFIGGANGIISGHNGKLAVRAESGLVLSSQGNAADVVISSGNATFAGDITFGDSHFIGDDADDNLLIASSANENIIIDSADDLILDAGGNDIRLKVNGVEYAKFKDDSDDLAIFSSIQDKDILFKGNDGGSTITALTLDMSNGGSATFRDDIDYGGKLNQTGTGTNTFAGEILIDGLSNYTGLEVKGSGASRPSIQWSNATQGDLGRIYGTEGNALVLASGSSNATSLTLDSSQNATFAGQVIASAGGIQTYANINSTGDAGLLIQNGARLGFDQSGTRSWTIKAYSGNLNIDSGDGSGKFSTGSKGINAGDIITVNKANSGAEGGGLLLQNSAGGSGAYNRIYFAPTASAYATRSAIIQGENVDGNNNMALVFKTSAGANPVEHMRIDQHGDVFVQGSGFFVGNNNTSGVTEVVLTNKDTSLVDAGDIQNRLKMRGLYYDQSSSLLIETQICSGHESANGNGNSFMAFYTQAGGSSPTEKMRLDSSGQLMIRRTADYSTDKYLLQVGDASLDDCIPAVFTVASTSARNQIVFSNFNNNLVGTIITSGSATSYNTSSDYRLKEDLQDFNGLEKVSNIKVYDFKWKDNDNYDEHSKRGYGVLAHELEEVLPQAVNGEKDAEEMQSVDYSKIVPLLVKSIQELKAEVDSCKQKCNCK